MQQSNKNSNENSVAASFGLTPTSPWPQMLEHQRTLQSQNVNNYPSSMPWPNDENTGMGLTDQGSHLCINKMQTLQRLAGFPNPMQQFAKARLSAFAVAKAQLHAAPMLKYPFFPIQHQSYDDMFAFHTEISDSQFRGFVNNDINLPPPPGLGFASLYENPLRHFDLGQDQNSKYGTKSTPKLEASASRLKSKQSMQRTTSASGQRVIPEPFKDTLPSNDNHSNVHSKPQLLDRAAVVSDGNSGPAFPPLSIFASGPSQTSERRIVPTCPPGLENYSFRPMVAGEPMMGQPWHGEAEENWKYQQAEPSDAGESDDDLTDESDIQELNFSRNSITGSASIKNDVSKDDRAARRLQKAEAWWRQSSQLSNDQTLWNHRLADSELHLETRHAAQSNNLNLTGTRASSALRQWEFHPSTPILEQLLLNLNGYGYDPSRAQRKRFGGFARVPEWAFDKSRSGMYSFFEGNWGGSI
jgi:hypothetical protein